MSSYDQVFSEVRGVLAHVFAVDPDTIVAATRAENVEGWDSLSHLIVITGIERQLNVRLPPTDAYAAQNVGALVELAHRMAQEQRGDA